MFEEPGLPLLLDIGCAKGRWAERMAGASPSTLPGSRHNFLGVELFAPLVAAANARRDAAGGGFCRDSLPLCRAITPLCEECSSLPPLGPLRTRIAFCGWEGEGSG